MRAPQHEAHKEGYRVADRYRLVRVLGRGGFAVVYEAVDERLDRAVAIKVLHAQRPEASDKARFDREARILATLDHPSIIPIYDYGIHQDRAFFAMKIARGRSLEAVLEDKRMIPVPMTLYVMRHLAAALAHAHARGVLHRDIKPANVLADEEGRILLADFGVGTLAQSPGVTSEGSLIGTLPYMAPEAFDNRVSESTDLYAAGVVMHEMLFGQRPFTEDSPAALIFKIVNEPPPLLQRPLAGVPEGVTKLLSELLAKRPEDRPQSAEALVQRLGGSSPTVRTRPVSRQEPVASMPPPSQAAEPATMELDLDSELEALENAAAAVERVTTSSTPVPDEILARLAEFTRVGSMTIERVRLAERGLDPEAALAIALSTHHLGRSVERQLESVASRLGDAWRGYCVRLAHCVTTPAAAVARRLESEQVRQGEDDDFFDSELGESDDSSGDVGWIAGLRGKDSLIRHESIHRMLNGGMGSLLTALGSQQAEGRDSLLDALWDNADLILLEGRGRARPLFEASAGLARDEAEGQRWRLLYGLFRRGPQGYAPLEESREQIEAMDEPHRRVLARALIFHPSATHRSQGRAWLDPNDCWEVIGHAKTPPHLLLEIWRDFEERASQDFKKVFLVCVREALEAAIEGPGIVAVVELLKEFFAVDPFHEDQYFGILMRMDAAVREGSRKAGLRVDLDSDYRNRQEQFAGGGQRPNRTPAGWTSVPLPVQRRIARSGTFLKHFSSHPVTAIAMECLPHLMKLEDITTHLENFSINRRLLEELAREKRFFRREGARYALLANPKTPVHIVSRYVRGLRKDFLRRLANSKDTNSNSRLYAERILGKGR
jgi:predicted Ser/Thr protein kinase